MDPADFARQLSPTRRAAVRFTLPGVPRRYDDLHGQTRVWLFHRDLLFHADDDRDGTPRFGLTEFGRAVRAAIIEQDRERTR
jgi:hypothetical protein